MAFAGQEIRLLSNTANGPLLHLTRPTLVKNQTGPRTSNSITIVGSHVLSYIALTKRELIESVLNPFVFCHLELRKGDNQETALVIKT